MRERERERESGLHHSQRYMLWLHVGMVRVATRTFVDIMVIKRDQL